MAYLVAVDVRDFFGCQLVGETYARREPGAGVDGDTAHVVFGERNMRSVSASSFLCDGVKFRWREGFVRSASHSSAHNSSADFEGVSVDVVGEVSG